MWVDIALGIGGFALAFAIGTFVEWLIHYLMHLRVMLWKVHTLHHAEGTGQGWFGEFLVYFIPSMPFMQAIGMEKDELVQALGVFFTVATLGLTINLTASGLLTATTALPGAVAMACSFTGMFIGQAVRTRMPAEAFRRWFLIAMIFLGLYLSGSAIYKLAHA